MGEKTDENGARVWTRTERKILAAWADPALHLATNAEIIRAAGCSSHAYYQAKADPEVQAERTRMCREHLADHLAAIYQASIDTAVTRGRDGQADRKMLLEMTREYVPRSELTGRDGGPVQVAAVDVPPRPETYEAWLAAVQAREAAQAEGDGE